jgi:hypothetical protein
MPCEGCGSANGKEFGTEMNIHIPGRVSLGEPGILIFPRLCICLDCGLARCALREDELRTIGERLAVHPQARRGERTDAA